MSSICGKSLVMFGWYLMSVYCLCHITVWLLFECVCDLFVQTQFQGSSTGRTVHSHTLAHIINTLYQWTIHYTITTTYSSISLHTILVYLFCLFVVFRLGCSPLLNCVMSRNAYRGQQTARAATQNMKGKDKQEKEEGQKSCFLSSSWFSLSHLCVLLGKVEWW